METDLAPSPTEPSKALVEGHPAASPSGNLDLILHVPVQLWVQLGSCRLPMKEVLELTSGTVLQLDQKSKDPVKLFVNDKLVALGEVVVVEDHFGIKITQLTQS
jgi:flagellar motor switch protein FliN/FliY